MTAFEPIDIQKYKRKAQAVTPDTVYWNRLAKPELLKEHSSIDYVDFSPADPDNFVLTCSVRVQVYNLVTKLVVKNLSRFQKTAYGATFRQDGRLVVAGDEEGHVKLFDINTRNILRLFKGHTAPVHRTLFNADKLQIASFADDRSVRLWDVANEKCVRTYEDAHNDYVRAGVMHPQAANMFASGGYDGKINIYDTRSESDVVQTLDHGSPVESMLFLPNGSIIITAGGTQVKVWDMLNGCRLLTQMSQHHKTVTCLRLGSDGRRLLSGGLDRHVKIYDVSTYKTVHTLTYSNAVVSLGVAEKDQAVVVGMVDGLVSIKRMIVHSHPSHLRKIRSTYREHRKQKQKTRIKPGSDLSVDHFIRERETGPQLKSFDVHLRVYAYKKALDSAFDSLKVRYNPEVVVAVINELLHRDGLAQALTDQPEAKLIRFIKFVGYNIGDIRFMRTLLNAASIMLDVYEHNVLTHSKKLKKAFERLSGFMENEIKLTKQLLELKGVLDMFIGASLDSGEKAHRSSFVEAKPPRIQPSKAAEKYVVLVE
ncbi:U3 small nucleolar RNA-associated protein 15 homolog [Scaptodrosophila lebanonensis]|uniref:U3 small nucleolar RNA-associated protein 15 homolog n=1 Tax=Drosophila lebanonensis TaxID=7225 RepID=A0A6J2TS92_DROLE|nr:U3 small nucleolar RNA-associated protein 15 homolog [Scaptodrosophila lebanonensis]